MIELLCGAEILSEFGFTSLYYMFIRSLLVEDLEFVSLLKAQVTIMVGFIAVYGQHKVVCKRNIVGFS